VNSLLLPTSADRAAVFAAAQGGPPFYDERLKLWVVLDHEQVSELLLDGRLVAPDLDAALQTVERHYGVALPNLRWAAGELPLVLNGERHARVRGDIAKLLSRERKSSGAWRQPVSQIVRSAFAAAGTIEAVTDLLLPIVNVVFDALTQVDAAFAPLTLTRVFDHYASYRHLMAAETGIATLRERLTAAGIPDEAIGTHVATIVLGRDSLLASLSEALIDLAVASRGRRLDQPAAKAPRLFGGVAVGERLVEEAFVFRSAPFAAGQRVRLYFQGYGYREAETERLAMFGAGKHSCLGRALALEVWALLATEIRGVPLTVQSVAFEYVRNSMFTMPKLISLTLG